MMPKIVNDCAPLCVITSQQVENDLSKSNNNHSKIADCLKDNFVFQEYVTNESNILPPLVDYNNETIDSEKFINIAMKSLKLANA
eukprot:scaffold103442_cov52-Attheya_sp.AAC.5